MATLKLKAFRCDKATESGADSPYFLIFFWSAGSTIEWESQNDTSASVGQRDRIRKTVVAEHYRDRWCQYQHPCFCRHDGRRRHLRFLPTAITSQICGVGWGQRLQVGAVSSTRPLRKRNELIKEFKKGIDACGTNDERLDVKRLVISKLSGDLPLLHFFGWDGHYHVRFNMA